MINKLIQLVGFVFVLLHEFDVLGVMIMHNVSITYQSVLDLLLTGVCNHADTRNGSFLL